LRVVGYSFATTEPKYGVSGVGSEKPVMQTCIPPSCPGFPWVIDRIRQYRSARFASLGSSSPMRIPGTFVSIGL
jgi:hypothetical protein